MTPRHGRLEALVPGLAAAHPRILLGVLPTPVTPVPDLARVHGLAGLAVKCDDATSPVYGGTKVRALEFFFGRAQADGRAAVATIGSRGSNHVVATTILAKQAGLDPHVVVFPHPEPQEAEANVRRVTDLGARVNRVGWLGLGVAMLRGPRAGARMGGPLWIPPGGTSPLGVLGAAEGALEVAAAVEAGVIETPDDVVVAAGSCGTAAGLVLGFALARLPVRVVAVRVIPRWYARRGRVLALARQGLALLRRAGLDAPALEFGPVVFVHDEAGAGYARPTAAGARAVAEVREAGIRAETTYTGKAWAHALSGALRGRRVLFWNTYGG